MSWVGIYLMKRLWVFPSSYPWIISSLKLKNYKICENMHGVTDPFWFMLFGIWAAVYWVNTSMDFGPSLNWSSCPNICVVSRLNFVCSCFNACTGFSFFLTMAPSWSPKRVSIWLNRFLAGPLLFLKFVFILFLEKWLKTKTLFLCNCYAITLVKMDLLNGKKSFLGTFFLDIAYFLNFLSISSRVEMLLSYTLANGVLINENVFKVL